jgi:CheY-like chemotaxis protein
MFSIFVPRGSRNKRFKDIIGRMAQKKRIKFIVFYMNGKILLIDDDPRNIFALKATLKAKGFDCYTATSAFEGLKILHGEKGITVVLLDMMMPDMDGYETLAAIRKDAATAQVAVVAVTAQAMKGDREKCLEAGANAYISKPIDVDILLETLQQFTHKI